MCAVLYKFAYQAASSRCWNSAANKSRKALANAEKIKAELDRTEAQRQEVLAQANAQATKLIEEARAAAARVQEQETKKAIAAAEQIMAKAREAAAQDHDRMLAELKREVGRLVVQATTDGYRQDSDRGRSATSGRGNFETDHGITMKITKQARREAKQLFRFCLVNGSLDENRVRQVVQRVVAAKDRELPGPILSHFLRLVKLDHAAHTAIVESATPLPAELQAIIHAGLKRR